MGWLSTLPKQLCTKKPKQLGRQRRSQNYWEFPTPASPPRNPNNFEDQPRQLQFVAIRVSKSILGCVVMSRFEDHGTVIFVPSHVTSLWSSNRSFWLSQCHFRAAAETASRPLLCMRFRPYVPDLSVSITCHSLVQRKADMEPHGDSHVRSCEVVQGSASLLAETGGLAWAAHF